MNKKTLAAAGAVLALTAALAQASPMVGGSGRIYIPITSAFALDILMVGCSSTQTELGASVACYQIFGLVVHDDAGTRLVCSPSTVKYCESVGEHGFVLVETDSSHCELLIKVGSTNAGPTMRWVANVRTAEVTYPQ